MLESTFRTLLVVGHVLLATTLLVDRSSLEDFFTPVISLLSAVVLFIVALASSNVETVANDGTVVAQSEQGIGIYAFSLGLIGFILTLYMLIELLPTDLFNGGTNSGF